MEKLRKNNIDYSPYGLTAPKHFIERVRQLSEGIYPKNLVEQLNVGEYKPVIIGFEHNPEGTFLAPIKELFQANKDKSPHPIKVAYEIIPVKALDSVKNFLAMGEKVKKLDAKRANALQLQLKEIKEKLLKSSGPEHLALWLLENGFEVIPIESEALSLTPSNHPSREDTVKALAMGIQREIYGLGLIARERPDVILAGWTHALKYDILLGRNGDQSFYVLPEDIDWEESLELFEEGYDLYKRHHNSN